MRVAVTGASGLIGSALVPYLRAQGHDVERLVRRPAAALDEISWDPERGTVDLHRLEGVDAVVHLAGKAVGDHRWNSAYKALIRDSRVHGTRTIATAMASLDRRPSVLVSASAIGYYGDTADRAVDESAPAGSGYFAGVCVDWEAAADPARAAGIRVVHSRNGLVVSGRGGAWGKLFPIVRLGVGGRLGSGRQWWSFISLRDHLAATSFLLGNLEGGVNVTAPNPVTNAEMIRAMGRLLHRPTVLPVPAKVLEIVLGEFSSEVLGSLRILPTRLLDAGFMFEDPTIDRALASAWASRSRRR